MKETPIIDAHQHAFKMEYEPDGTPVRNPVTGSPSTATSDETLISETLAQMDRNNIVKALIGGTPEIIPSWIQAAPTRFIPSVELRGNPITPTVQEVRELLENGTVKAIGEILTQYHALAPNDPKLDPYYALAEEYDIPAWIHVCGGGAHFPTFRVKYGNPILVEDVLEKYQELRLCVCHCGIPFMSEMASMLYMYPRLHADLSAYNWMMGREPFYDFLKGVLGLSGAHRRLMFGSDQMRWPEAISWAVDTIEQAPFLSEEQKRDIFYNNAKRFLRL